MNRFLHAFPIACFVLAGLSVFADIRGAISYFAWGSGSEINLLEPLGFQTAMIVLKAIINSLQWVAYGVLGELLIRQLIALRAIQYAQDSKGRDDNA